MSKVQTLLSLVFASSAFVWVGCAEPIPSMEKATIAANPLNVPGAALVPVNDGTLTSTMAEGVILSLHGPSELIPGQAFRLRISSDYRVEPGRGTAMLHAAGADEAIRVDVPPLPSAASVPGMWSVYVDGKIEAAHGVGGRHSIEIALLSGLGQVGPIAVWSPFVHDAPAVQGCPSIADCSAQECGNEPVCGQVCGHCTPGLACNDRLVCEPVGAACPAAANCGARQCGVDPYCGIACGSACPEGLSCSEAGQCVLPGGTTTVTGSGGTDGGETWPDTTGTGCLPDCTQRVCGLDPACPTTSCGECQEAYECEEGRCVCEPDCADRECGVDPRCGRSCGACGSAQQCQDGTCVGGPGCPDAKECSGRECGPDPVCGETCGDCDSGLTCVEGRCVDGQECPDAKDCTGLECGVDPVCGASCGTCGGHEVCIAGECAGDGGLCPGAETPVPCVDGFAGENPCKGTALLAYVSKDDMGGGGATDVWGWEQGRRKVALVATNEGLAAVDVSNPCAPVYLGRMEANGKNSSHYDVKVAGDHAYVVSEKSGHGMQILDLRGLPAVKDAPRVLTATATYLGVSNAHNVVANESAGTVYVVGSNSCSGGLHAVDVSDPSNPREAGCWGEHYIHDANCFTYHGPDSEHVDKEICVTSDGGRGSVSVVDMTDPAAAVLLSSVGYPSPGYSHQGWVTADQQYYLHGDEFDEMSLDGTRTLIFDLRDLDSIAYLNAFTSQEHATDHNLYVRGDHVYQANYLGGMRVLDASDVAAGQLREVGHFDTTPDQSGTSMSGAWSVYPFFEDGTTLITDNGGGMWIVLPVPFDLP